MKHSIEWDSHCSFKLCLRGCKWWHFFPSQPFADHVAKFHELTNNSIELDIRVLTR